MPEDEELEKLKKERQEELKREEESQEEAVEDRRNQIKQQAKKYLTREASSRLGNIRAADEEKASAIEMQIARMGEMGQISENEITDDRLKQILRSIGKNEGQDQTDLKFRR